MTPLHTFTLQMKQFCSCCDFHAQSWYLTKQHICSLRWVAAWHEWCCMHVEIPQQKDNRWRASGIERRKASLFESLRRVCHPLWQSEPILAAKGSNRAFGERCMCHSWRNRKSGGCESRVGQERVGGRAVEQMWAELRTSFTQRHSPIDASVTAWSRKGEGRKTETTLNCKPS